MGRLTFPSGSRLYLDTSPIIYSVEEHDVYWPELQPIWTAFSKEEIQIVTSELSLLETLVRPIRDGNTDLAKTYDELLTGDDVFLIPVNTDILRTSAELRARHNFKTPDAIHAATALASNCEVFISNDAGFRRLENINVVILSDLL